MTIFVVYILGIILFLLGSGMYHYKDSKRYYSHLDSDFPYLIVMVSFIWPAAIIFMIMVQVVKGGFKLARWVCVESDKCGS